MNRRQHFPIAVLAAALLACVVPRPSPANDERQEAGHRVRFSVESSREVPNDWVTAVVGISAEATDAAAVAETVNQAMSWALGEVRAEERVKARSRGYHTQPVHKDGKLRRWRASQELILESEDSEALTQLVGSLQSRLQLRSFTFSVSRGSRERVQEQLVAEALAAFQVRARLVTHHLGASGYAIDELNLETGAQGPRPMMRASVAEASLSGPAVESGSTRVTVVARGTIVLD